MSGYKESANKLIYDIDFDYITGMAERMQMNYNTWEEETLLKIRREFSEKEKYNILMDDYFQMIRKVTHIDELEQKYLSLKEQHKQLQSKYTKLRNQLK
jgi:hypothetical protein